MLEEIRYQFPSNTKEESAFFSALKILFSELKNSQIKERKILITPFNSQHSLPVTVFEEIESHSPTLDLIFTNKDEYAIASFLQESLLASGKIEKQTIFPIGEFTQKISGHIIRIDHTGVNIPAIKLSKAEWEEFIRKLAKTTALYRYPTGEDWPFVLPSTQIEYETSIRDFVLGREPKFELVYDHYTSLPTFQFDIETDLTKQEVEKLFPAPIGVSFSGLEEFFRAVYVSSPWETIQIRFDVRFKDDNKDNNWVTGKWLVEEGGRIK